MDCYAIGTSAEDDIIGNIGIYDGVDGWIQKDRILYYGKEYEKIEMPEKLKGKIIARNIAENRLYEKESVFLPLQRWEAERTIVPAQVIVRYELKNRESVEKVNQKIVDMLSERHPECFYQVNNYLDHYRQSGERSLEYAKYMAMLSGVGIWIMTLGYLGVARQLYIKRQKEYAVCLSIGATVKKLICEMLLENVCILFAGVLLIFVIGFIINFSTYTKIKRLEPQEIIRSIR